MRVYHDFFWYPDPDQRFLIRIRIRPNDTDPTGSGSETLHLAHSFIMFYLIGFVCEGGWYEIDKLFKSSPQATLSVL